jgi:hypothetical protein
MPSHRILLRQCIPKSGNHGYECEDVMETLLDKEADILNIAIADGATESIFSREWAEILIKGITSNRIRNKKSLAAILPSLRNQWEAIITNRELPWFAEAKAEKGAFSALLFVQLDFKNSKYIFWGIGDCCLFLIRKKKLVKKIPYTEITEFGENPFLMPSKHGDFSELEQHFFTSPRKLQIKGGDQFLIMTDALAAWFLRMAATGGNPWDTLTKFKHEDEFKTWLSEERTRKTILNDDVTLLIIEII